MEIMHKIIPQVSVIVEVHKGEEYLAECLDSLFQENLHSEVILIYTESSYRLTEITDVYRQKGYPIVEIQQRYADLAAARNNALDIAQGKYITFISSCDYIAIGSLSRIYNQVVDCNVDVIRGKMKCFSEKGYLENIFEEPPSSLKNIVISGKQYFVSLMESETYCSTSSGYLYRKEWIQTNHIRFGENIVYEDELWTPIALCLAEKIILTDIDFYYYRQREELHSEIRIRVDSLFYIAEKLIRFSNKYKFLEEDFFLKGWMYVNIYRIYAIAFTLLIKIQDSTFLPRRHYLYTFRHISNILDIKARIKCKNYYLKAKKKLKIYLLWRLNLRTGLISDNEKEEKKIILIYNKPLWYNIDQIKDEDIPSDFIITLDRRFLKKAYAIVFHLPDLSIDDDIEKLDNQIWIGWSMECEKNHSWLRDPEVTNLFDLHMNYHLDSDVPCLYHHNFNEKLVKSNSFLHKENKVCMFISSMVNQSKRLDYIKELMKYINIDSYGSWLKNKSNTVDLGRSTKLEVYSKYKFVIAFENAIYPDYVTEKLYHPLLVGAVPIYLGAPNIGNLVPGDNCFVDVRNYKNPKELALFIEKCFVDDNEFLKFHEWRSKPFKDEFIRQEEQQNSSCFSRLCKILTERYN